MPLLLPQVDVDEAMQLVVSKTTDVISSSIPELSREFDMAYTLYDTNEVFKGMLDSDKYSCLKMFLIAGVKAAALRGLRLRVFLKMLLQMGTMQYMRRVHGESVKHSLDPYSCHRSRQTLYRA